MIYALDSNIVSYMLKSDTEVLQRFWQEDERGNAFIIPAIVFYEVQRGLLAKKLNNRLSAFEKLCATVKHGSFDKSVWQKAAEIYASLQQQGKPIGGKWDGDILIAAYCIVNGYTLVTNNTCHFERIDGLKSVNWKN